jgi:hypothetical protein
LGVVRAAARADRDEWQVPALEASLDALATHKMPSLGEAAGDAALVNRTREAPVVASELARAASEAKGPFAKGLIARALGSVAQQRGDAVEAERQRQATGCVREAIVMGPTTWTPVTGVDEAGPLDRPEARIEPSYATGDAFGTQTHPVAVRGRGCTIELSVESSRPGVRDVVVDLEVGRAQSIGLALRAHGAATLRAGGVLVARRPFELGDGEAARFVRVSATAGKLRLVARVGTAKDNDTVEIDAFAEDGSPLPSRAPAVGSTSSARVLAAKEVTTPWPKSDDESLLRAAAALASGDARSAETMLWNSGTRANAKADLALVYAQAVETVRDLSPATRAERARSAYERVLEVWPASWRAIIGHAVLAGVRRGRDEAGMETLRDLDTLRDKAHAAAAPLLDAFDALTSGRERLFDRARTALERAHEPLSATALLADAEDAASPRIGAELVSSACDPTRLSARDSLACFDALRASGDRAGAARELNRLRGLVGAPDRFLALELHEALAAGDEAAARRSFAAMLPAERTMVAVAMLDGGKDARAHLLRIALTARDAPASIAPLLRAAGDEPTSNFDGLAERLAAEDRVKPFLPNAATAVLAHSERYDVLPEGLAHWVLFDVRRVNGTTDVEENAQAAPPELWGRGAMRALRRRILKRDGRILEPDRAPHASQAHADLSQLEQGDVVEAIYEGWSLPGDTGDVGIDTPDLLPDRTAVHDATIELRLPRGLRGALWSHPLLGQSIERDEGGTRVLAWRLADRPARRVEDGIPRMDRSVAVSFSTAQWSDVARALRETIATLDEHDPEIAAWAQEAAARAEKSPQAIVQAVVTAAGKVVREADPETLSDFGGGSAQVQTQTARTFLASHAGSRSWLVVRGLRELGIPSDVVVAETDPYSADPAFPPHFGRFVHPLVVAHVLETPGPNSGGTARKDLWIDADVAGPPLPAGRVSPELRGRLGLYANGTIAPLTVPAAPGDERDEVDVRLALDATGTARGTFAIMLRGRDAQELAEALVRIVGAERQRALRDVVLAWLPWANVDDVQLASTEGSWQVSLRAQVSVSGYAQLEGDRTWMLPGMDTLHWVSPRARVSSLASAFATRGGRENALALSNAVQYHLHRRIEIPKGATVARMPGPLDVKAKLVEASRTITVTEGAIEDDFVLGVATGTIPATEYGAFVGAAHAADDGFLASTRVTMP